MARKSTARPVGEARITDRSATIKPAKAAKRSGSKTRTSKSWTQRSLLVQARCLVGSVGPLLELFAALDDVFTEDEALSPEFRKVSLGRCYEAWQKCRKAFDPDFVAANYRRPRGRGMRHGLHSR